jgi:hypothetical protein
MRVWSAQAEFTRFGVGQIAGVNPAACVDFCLLFWPSRSMEQTLVYNEVTFHRLSDCDSGRVIQNLDLRGCSFDNCRLSMGRDPAKRTIVRGIVALDCRILGRFGVIGAPILTDITIDGLRSGQILIFSGAAFQRVVLKGHMPSVNFNEVTAFGSISEERAAAFQRTNQEFYKAVDWALDISEADFPSLRPSSIPGELIRRDRNTQILVSKGKLLQIGWKSLPLPASTRIGVEACLRSRYEHYVICAGRRSSRFDEELSGLDILRHAGASVD